MNLIALVALALAGGSGAADDASAAVAVPKPQTVQSQVERGVRARIKGIPGRWPVFTVESA